MLLVLNQIWIVFTHFRQFRLVPKQSEKCNYNPKFGFIHQDSMRVIVPHDTERQQSLGQLYAFVLRDLNSVSLMFI